MEETSSEQDMALDQEVQAYIDAVELCTVSACPEKESRLIDLCKEQNREDLKENLIVHMREQMELTTKMILRYYD